MKKHKNWNIKILTACKASQTPRVLIREHNCVYFPRLLTHRLKLGSMQITTSENGCLVQPALAADICSRRTQWTDEDIETPLEPPNKTKRNRSKQQATQKHGNHTEPQNNHQERKGKNHNQAKNNNRTKGGGVGPFERSLNGDMFAHAYAWHALT